MYRLVVLNDWSIDCLMLWLLVQLVAGNVNNIYIHQYIANDDSSNLQLGHVNGSSFCLYLCGGHLASCDSINHKMPLHLCDEESLIRAYAYQSPLYFAFVNKRKLDQLCALSSHRCTAQFLYEILGICQ